MRVIEVTEGDALTRSQMCHSHVVASNTSSWTIYSEVLTSLQVGIDQFKCFMSS